jgi:hypothetical protein
MERKLSMWSYSDRVKDHTPGAERLVRLWPQGIFLRGGEEEISISEKLSIFPGVSRRGEGSRLRSTGEGRTPYGSRRHPVRAEVETVVLRSHRFDAVSRGYVFRSVEVLLVAVLIGSACSGIRPYPRYTLNQQGVRMQRVIESYLNTPYRWGGEDSNGVDCSGLVVVVFRGAHGVSLPHRTEELFQMGQRVNSHSIRFGDLVFFAEKGGTPTHVGIGLGGDRFVHASSECGVIISSLKTSYFRERFIGARRLF